MNPTTVGVKKAVNPTTVGAKKAVNPTIVGAKKDKVEQVIAPPFYTRRYNAVI